ncbi:DinB family protein [Fodinicola acaciae]|uniref:DinB family protein n=1 Tax=Fodinicola acaciae TaxID=2681555 RepID=UPI001C9E8C31|nr:DinB family protein [Fodinicola acaciae]
MNWSEQLADQLDWHWRNQLRERLEGLTDEEYLWQPVEGAWTVRPRTSDDEPGTGDFTIDWMWPPPEPAPVTTIAWRLAHILVGVFGMRNASHFGGPPTHFSTYDYPGQAGVALARLDDAYKLWIESVRALDDDALARPCGPAEPYPDLPMAALVLHIHREAIHHGAEIALLRDLYLRR